MLVTHLGHDGLRVEPADFGGAARAVLVDPWLNPAGAFAGGWFQYPPATVRGDDAAWQSRCLEGVGALVVTQALPEHLDPWVVGAALPATVPILVVRTPSSELAMAVRNLRQPHAESVIIELEPWQWHTLAEGGLQVALVPEVSARHAAAVVVQQLGGGGHALVHLGEAKLSALHARCLRVFLGAPPALVTLRTNVAHYSPLCTAADEQRRFARGRQARRDRQEAALTLLRILKPQAALLAGPSVCLLDNDLARSQTLQHELDGGPQTDVVAEAETFHRRFATEVRPWQRGDVVDTAQPAHTETQGRLPVPESLDAYASAKADVIAQQTSEALGSDAAVDEASLWAALQAWFGTLLESCESLRKRINLRLWIEASDESDHAHGNGSRTLLGRYRVDVRERARIVRVPVPTSNAGNKAATAATTQAPQEDDGTDEDDGPSDDATLRAPARWLHAVMSGRCDWATLLYSMRFRFDSEASRTRLEQLLELLHLAGNDPATAGARAQARIAAVQWLPVPDPQGGSGAGGGAAAACYWVGRHCPHAQVDLLICGELLAEGTLRCLAHSYDFSLPQAGRCLNAPECAALPVKR